MQPLRKQPIPLLGGDEANYLLALKKEFVQTMQCSPYHIKAEVEKVGKLISKMHFLFL